jgi:mannose-1-phosphate guanylyltransferase
MNKNNYAVIMAGGIGSRFWPMSKTSYPKQFLDILNTGRTLLQSTYDRFAKIVPEENIFIVTSVDYVSIVKEQLPDIPLQNIVGEPERKNTAPCIALIALKIKKLNSNANLVISPSDHLIENETAFRMNCDLALDYTANHNALLTLGIRPTHANTGYGYIQYGESLDFNAVFKVRRFTEKPDKTTAIQFLKEGYYLWNSGIFFWRAENIINSFRLLMPEMFDVFICGYGDLNTEKEADAIKHIYRHCPSISIDYGILEKAENVSVIPADFIWNDLGTWNSAWENTPKDDDSNAIGGSNTMVIDSKGCIVHSTDKKLVLVGGVQDLIVVNTPEALLVCTKENEQQIKDYLAVVRETKGEMYL